MGNSTIPTSFGSKLTVELGIQNPSVVTKFPQPSKQSQSSQRNYDLGSMYSIPDIPEYVIKVGYKQQNYFPVKRNYIKSSKDNILALYR